MEYLLLLWIEGYNQKQIPTSGASIQAKAFKLVVALKERVIIRWLKKILPVKAGFIVSEVCMNWLMLSYLMKQQTQIRMLLWNLHPDSKNYRQSWLCTTVQDWLSCTKHFARFGWNINEVVKDVDDRGNVDTASIQELVLGMQPVELSEGKHIYKWGQWLFRKRWTHLGRSDTDEKLHIKGTLRYFTPLRAQRVKFRKLMQI